MMELQVLNGNTLSVNDEVFGREFNEGLVHQTVVAYMAAARAGTIRSPLWRTGGKIFAAKPRDYTQKLNKKMYRAAMCSIFSELLRQDRLIVVPNLAMSEPKTKLAITELAKYGTNDVLFVTDGDDANLLLATRNIPYCEVLSFAELNPVSLVGHEKVVATETAIAKIQEWLA
jgi:large subunit ribosomal protein L4